jgi:hypothetical protein
MTTDVSFSKNLCLFFCIILCHTQLGMPNFAAFPTPHESGLGVFIRFCDPTSVISTSHPHVSVQGIFRSVDRIMHTHIHCLIAPQTLQHPHHKSLTTKPITPTWQ